MQPSKNKRMTVLALGLILFGFLLFANLFYANAASGELASVYLPVIVKQLTPTPTVTSTPTATPSPIPVTPPPPEAGWLAYVNYHRALARLPAVAENTTWSAGDQQHACYMVKNDYIGHDEPGGSAAPCFSQEGVLAARNSNVMVSGSTNTTDNQAIDLWMQGPFHAVGIIDPALLQVGFGSYREAGTGPGPTDWQMGAALDIIRGLGMIPASVAFPVKWPGDGMAVLLRTYDGYESPNPLISAGCNFSIPTGLPLILQLGDGSLTPIVTAYSFKQGDTLLESCEFDETNYAEASPGSTQDTGRAILNARDAVVIIPKDPLAPGATYTVSVTANGQTYTWSFSVSPSAAALKTLEAGLEVLIR